MKIKVFVSNLGAYNAGTLTGKWITLPVDNVEAIYKEDKKKFGNLPNYGEEYFISDYEVTDSEGKSVNYRIDEDTDLGYLNEIATKLEDYPDVESIYNQLDSEQIDSLYLPYIVDFDEDGLECLIGNNKLMAIIQQATCGDIHSLNDEYIFLNGVNNLESISESDFQKLLNEHATEIIRLMVKGFD